MTYTRGSNAEYDRWARITGDSSWSWEKLSPYYLKVRNTNYVLGASRLTPHCTLELAASLPGG